MYGYRTGSAGWYALARGPVVVVLETAAVRQHGDALWNALAADADAAALLDLLVAGGLSSAPDFGIIDGFGTEQVRVLLRGAPRLTLQTTAGERVLDGRGVRTWAEQLVEGVTAFQLELGGKVSGGELPLVEGVVSAASIGSRTPTAVAEPIDAEAMAEAAPAPVVEPERIPEPQPVVVPEPVVSSEDTLSMSRTITPPPPPPPPPLAKEPEPAPAAASGYDHLFGETVIRDVESAAVRETEESEPTEGIGEHTVMVGDIAALRAQRRSERRNATPAAPAVRFALELFTGARELLDQPIIIGRAPSAERVTSTQVPRLVSVTTPNQDISRTHVRFALEGDTVVVTDLHSRNGTMVALPGRAPQKLRAGEPTAVIAGTVVDLGDGALITVAEVAG